MKRNILISLAAMCCLMVGCRKELVGDLSNLSVDKSYVCLELEESSTTIKVNAKESWTFYNSTNAKDANAIPSWLTISPLNGEAGETEVTFTATAASFARSATLKIIPGTDSLHVQYIVVGQGIPQIEEATCAEVNKGVEGKTYRITGTVTRIDQSKLLYGNWYIQDETGSTQVYGTKYNGQTQQTPLAKLGIEEGDVATIEGPLKFYNGAAELVDVDVISVKKSLIKVPETKFDVEKDDTTITVKAIVKGDYYDFSEIVFPDGATPWITLCNVSKGTAEETDEKGKPITVDYTFVSYHINANEGDLRTATINLKSSSKKGESIAAVTVNQKSGLNEYKLPFEETFASSFGVCEVNNVTLPEGSTYVWKIDESYGCAKGSSYVSGQRYASESWIVTPLIDLTTENAAELSFDYCAANGVDGKYNDFFFAAVITDTDTTKLTLEFPNPYTKYTWINSKFDLKDFIGKKVKLAVVYTSTPENCGTFEVKNLKVDVKYSEFKDITKAGKFVSKDALVVAVASTNTVVTDGTGYMFIYDKNKVSAVGDKLTLAGAVTIYNGCMEWNNPTITKQSSGNEVVHPEAVEMNDDWFNAYKTTPTIVYGHLTGTKAGYVVTNGAVKVNLYTNGTIADGSVDVYGYTIGFDSREEKQQVNFVVCPAAN